MTHLTSPTISIRAATSNDGRTLTRLAALDSAPALPSGPVLVAEVDGEPRAALSLHDGRAVADPFEPTAELVTLLRMHAGTFGAQPRSGREEHPRFAQRLGLAA